MTVSPSLPSSQILKSLLTILQGVVRPHLFHLRDEKVPIESIVQATNEALSQLSQKERSKVAYHIDAPEWRTWSNPEFLLSDKGVRLEDVSEEAREKFLRVLQTTFSPEGYQKAVSAMRINGFLGELVKSPAVMNEFSYNFVLFGEPSTTRPWGISFYGHHLCINMFFYKTQIIISPCFTGAEPNTIDVGPYKGTRILLVEEVLGLRLMQSLPLDQKNRAQVYKHLRDPKMPPGRWNQDDQRHLCGAYQDNRIIPYEGVIVASMSHEQQSMITAILDQYLIYLPETARKIHLDNIQSWFHETYFCWIGSFGESDPFYYRIQSPVIIVEFDHHSGVILTNKNPARFHIHTTLRIPNSGDYGFALKALAPAQVTPFVWEGTYPWEVTGKL